MFNVRNQNEIKLLKDKIHNELGIFFLKLLLTSNALSEQINICL